MSKGPTFTFSITDDYRAGPELHFVVPDDEEDERLDTYEVEFPPLEAGVVSVLEMAMSDDGTGNVVVMKTFAQWDEAERYAKLQYQLYTGAAPFIEDGKTGKRPRIECDNDDEEHALTLEPAFGSELLHWIVIAHSDYDIFDAHSLNPFAIW